MSRKRRIFDIDMPDEPAAEQTFPAGKDEPTRRGPMAAAIAETADSVRERRVVEDQIRAENDALAQEHVRLKQLGLITDLVPLDQIETYKLIRDRGPQEDFELAELIDSIRDIGLSNPIRVELRADGRYELIQGFRRLSAYRALLSQTGNQDVYGSIPAGIVAQGKDLESLYRQMVDENLVRKDISFAEMAQLAVTYAMDPETEEHDADKAVAVLFQSAGYQKRSYIRSFIKLVQSLGEDLMYASEIPRSLGLQLVARLEEVPGVAAAIREELKDWPQRSIKDELGVLRNYVGAGDAATSRPKNLPRGEGPAPSKAKTTFQIDRAHGRAKCVAAQGKLEIKLNRDFTAIDPRRLEAAVRSLLDQLD